MCIERMGRSVIFTHTEPKASGSQLDNQFRPGDHQRRACVIRLELWRTITIRHPSSRWMLLRGFGVRSPRVPRVQTGDAHSSSDVDCYKMLPDSHRSAYTYVVYHSARLATHYLRLIHGLFRSHQDSFTIEIPCSVALTLSISPPVSLPQERSYGVQPRPRERLN